MPIYTGLRRSLICDKRIRQNWSGERKLCISGIMQENYTTLKSSRNQTQARAAGCSWSDYVIFQHLS